MKFRGRPHGFRPCVQALEDRCVPSATASVFGRILIITGSGAADQVVINDGGNASGKVIQVFSEGNLVRQVNGDAINLIFVNLRGGNDNLQYNLQGDLNGASAGAFRAVVANLGRG